MRHLLALCCLSGGLLASTSAWAGVYSDEMGKCLVTSTSTQDKTALVRWLFATAALHPDVRPIANVDDETRDRMDREVAALMERLVTESCRKETKEAIRYEGGLAAFRNSFGILGEVAMQELMTNEKVNTGFGAFTKYLDEEKFEALGLKSE